jgi:hypothetical protein
MSYKCLHVHRRHRRRRAPRRPVVIYNNFYTGNILSASRKQREKKSVFMPTLLFFFLSFLLSFFKALTGRTALATPEITEERASESGYNSLLVPQRAQRRKERFEFNVMVNVAYTLPTRAQFITTESCIFFIFDYVFASVRHLPLKSLKFSKISPYRQSSSEWAYD